MISGIILWNEPNNLAHWDFRMDPEWLIYTEMMRAAARAIRSLRPDLKLVLGGISPIDPQFIEKLEGYGLLEEIDVVGVHGFPFDWDHWKIDEWPQKIAQIEAISRKPVWVTEVGVSSYGADEVQEFGLKRSTELLIDRVANTYWYSLLDLPRSWEAITRCEEDSSGYWRNYHMGLIREDGTPKLAIDRWDPRLGICQWIHYEDPRLESILDWLRRLNVKKVRTGISWADWHRPRAWEWFDKQMAALEDFDCLITLCFTPPSLGRRYCHNSPPIDPHEFAYFASEIVERYVLPMDVKKRITASA